MKNDERIDLAKVILCAMKLREKMVQRKIGNLNEVYLF